MSEGRIRVYGRRLSNREIADLLPLSAERQRERNMLVEEQNLLKQCLSAMPVGYIPTHTAENLPEMICDLAKALAEETTERENLERELATVTEQRDRLAEACILLMRVIGDPNASAEDWWATEDEINAAWNSGSEALAAVEGGQS